MGFEEETMLDKILRWTEWFLRIVIWGFLIVGVLSFIILICMGYFWEALIGLFFGVGLGSLAGGGASLKDYAFLIWWNQDKK